MLRVNQPGLCTLIVFIIASAILPANAADDATTLGHVITARATGDALLIWDASDSVTKIVTMKIPDSEANAKLERNALHLLASKAADLKGTTTISLRIVYNKTGDVSPVYGSATFAGVERYALLSIRSADLISDRDKWRELDEKAAIPPWIGFKILGTLPPRN